jgi:hypothetical protein
LKFGLIIEKLLHRNHHPCRHYFAPAFHLRFRVVRRLSSDLLAPRVYLPSVSFYDYRSPEGIPLLQLHVWPKETTFRRACGYLPLFCPVGRRFWPESLSLSSPAPGIGQLGSFEEYLHAINNRGSEEFDHWNVLQQAKSVTTRGMSRPPLSSAVQDWWMTLRDAIIAAIITEVFVHHRPETWYDDESLITTSRHSPGVRARLGHQVR